MFRRGRLLPISSTYCIKQKCRNDGRCDFLYQAAPCTCLLSYTGVFCETNRDNCTPDADGSVPCKNDDKCFDGINRFIYDCLRAGLKGIDCFIDINECVEQTIDCGYGRCKKLPGTYHCSCDSEYYVKLLRFYLLPILYITILLIT